ncbi:MAG: YeeE/YedE thiosulfate transporter family protein, partial [bacterium]|nr:YeeE/YedE thiosulfate transporter family protein [bacterium]
MAFYIFFFVERWPWWLGGIFIGILVPIMYYFLNTPMGVSTGYGNIVKIILPKTKLKWFSTEKFKDVFGWRFLFVSGMIIGGFISARTAKLPILNFEMGTFTANLNWSFGGYAIWFFVGGLLLA